MNKKKILIIDCGSPSLTYKIVYFLRKYFEITLIQLLIRGGVATGEYEKLGVKFYSFNIIGCGYSNPFKILSGFREILNFLFFLNKLKKQKYNYVLTKVGYNRVAYLIFKIFKDSKKIYFPYDIDLFSQSNKGDRRKLEIFAEKYCFENADYIFHKGPEWELDLIKKEEVKKIEGRPIQLLPWCFDEWMSPLRSNKSKQKKIQLIYAGGYPSKFDPLYKIQFREVAKLIAKQSIDLHIYPLQKVKAFREREIHIHKSLPNAILNRKISKYHYGISISFLNKDKIDPRFSKTTVGNKIFTYLEAGIPIIIDDNAEFMASLVRKYNCGIVISEKDLYNLSEIIRQADYDFLMQGVKKARENLLMSKNIKKIFLQLND